MQDALLSPPGRLPRLPALGRWSGGITEPLEPELLQTALARVREPLFVVRDAAGTCHLARGGSAVLDSGGESSGDDLELVAWAAPTPLESLGDGGFRQDLGLRYAYVAGAMANGIGSAELVEAMAHAGMIGFFGAAGLAPAAIEDALERLETRLGDLPWGSNLIHSPYEPELEAEVASLYLRRGLRVVSASAYLRLTLPLVRYRVTGIHRAEDGRIVVPNRILAKVSRVEVARQFFAPPPEKLLRELVTSGEITTEQAELASRVPMAQEVTAEADSGGHTDNRPALALVPTLTALRDRMQEEYGDDFPLRVGAAGGISTPASVLAAFGMGAAYVLTGSINQACREAGTSDLVRQMLAETEQADVTMAPAADMFEMGVKLQVLKRGTLFAMRAQKLYDLWRAHGSLDELPDSVRSALEEKIFRQPLDRVEAETESFWQRRDPSQVERARRDPRHRMALVFRWYLGLSSRWANAGQADRRADFQVWCGPAMGAFNEWVRGSWLESWEERRAAPIGLNLLHGAATMARANALTAQGVPGVRPDLRPRRPADLEEFLHE